MFSNKTRIVPENIQNPWACIGPLFVCVCVCVCVCMGGGGGGGEDMFYSVPPAKKKTTLSM